MAGVAARLTWRGFTDLTADTESCVQLVSRAGIIPIERTCGKCGREMHWERDNSQPILSFQRCRQHLLCIRERHVEPLAGFLLTGTGCNISIDADNSKSSCSDDLALQRTSPMELRRAATAF